MSRTPESMRPDAARLRLAKLNKRISELESAPAAEATGGGLTSPIALTDIDATGVPDGDVIVASGGAFVTATPGTGTVISGFVNVTMEDTSGTATFTHGSITPTSIVIPAIAGVSKSDHDPEDHMLEELQVYAVNQIAGQVEIVIVSPNGGSFGDYQVNVIVI